MKKLIHDSTTIIAILLLSTGFAFAQDQVEQSFERAFSQQETELDFSTVLESWDRFLAEPGYDYFTNVRYSFVRQMGAPLTIKTKTGKRNPQALVLAGWDELITNKELKKGTPKAQAKLAKR
ncbi:MAG: hypothetical protein OEZ32_11490 [Nitrospinota bacterium]|nr:hypothetical protein [Nitrospinota bacterium]